MKNRHNNINLSSRLSISDHEYFSENQLSKDTPFLIILEDCDEESMRFSFNQISLGYDHMHNLGPEEYSRFIKRPQHQHTFIEIMYVLSGAVTDHVGSQTFVYHQGECTVMNRNVSHKEDLTGKFKVAFIDLQEDFIKSLISEEEAMFKEASPGYRKYIRSQLISMLLSAGDDDSRFKKIYYDCLPAVPNEIVSSKAVPLINNIIKHSKDLKPGSLYMIKSCLQQFLALLCDPGMYSITEMSSELSKHDFLMKKIRHVMETRHGKITRSELAEQLYYNEDHLNRIIKEQTGMTFSGLRQQILLNEVQQLLIETDWSVSRIADHLGITNRSYFYSVFRKEFGMNPLEYRQNIRS